MKLWYLVFIDFWYARTFTTNHVVLIENWENINYGLFLTLWRSDQSKLVVLYTQVGLWVGLTYAIPIHCFFLF